MLRYYGFIDDEIPSGLGLIIYPEGKSDMGFFYNGILNGISRIFFPNCDIYYGNISDGQVTGKGLNLFGRKIYLKI